MGNTAILHKIGPDPKPVHFVDHHDDVVTEDLAKSLVHHRRVVFASEGIPELPLDHLEGRLDIRAPMIVGQKFISPQAEVLEHLVPCTRNSIFWLAVGLEGDKRGRPGLGNGVDVLTAEVSLVRRDFLHREVLRGRVQKRREKGSIVLLAVRDLGGGDDVGLSAAHQVGLEPCTPGAFLSPFVLNPPGEPGSAEAGHIDGEAPLNCRQGKTRLRDEVLEDCGHLGFLEDVEDAVVVGNLTDESPGMSFPEITHEAATGDGAVDFERSRKEGIRYRDRLAARFSPDGFRNAAPEVSQQDLELVLLVDLGVVVGWPVLRVGPLGGLRDADAFPNGLGAVSVAFFNGYLNGHDVLAEDPASVEVRAGAAGRPVEANGVGAAFALRRDDPLPFLLLNPEEGCDLNCFDLPGVHDFSLRCKGYESHNRRDSLHGCLWHLASLGFVGCYQHPTKPVCKLAAGVGFEPTSRGSARLPDLESGPMNRSGTPPPSSFLGFLLLLPLLYLLLQHLHHHTASHEIPLIGHRSFNLHDHHLVTIKPFKNGINADEGVAPVFPEVESGVLQFLADHDRSEHLSRGASEYGSHRIGQTKTLPLQSVKERFDNLFKFAFGFWNRPCRKLQESHCAEKFQIDVVPDLVP